jgi:hypothetical protein
LVLCLLALAGCASGAQPTAAGSSQPSGTQAGTPGAGVVETAAVNQSLALPGGKTLTAQETNGVQWQGLDLKLLAVGVGTTDPIGSAVGNHATVVSQEPVTLSAGAATLVLVERSQPAAAQATAGTAAASQEYWLIVLRSYPGRTDMNLAYVLQASFSGAPADARAQILDLAKGWQLPQEGTAG